MRTPVRFAIALIVLVSGHIASPANAADSPSRNRRDESATGELAEIRIPRLWRISYRVFEGVQDSSLDRGTGHYPGTALPGDLGNVVILGHRTTHLAPFRDLDRLRRGDEIFLSSGSYTYRYIVRVSKISTPVDSSLVSPDPLGDTGSPRRLATLITCHPKGSTTKRFVVIAELVKRVRRT